MKFYGVQKDYDYEGVELIGFFKKRENAEKYFKDKNLGEFDDIIEIEFQDDLYEKEDKN